MNQIPTLRSVFLFLLLILLFEIEFLKNIFQCKHLIIFMKKHLLDCTVWLLQATHSPSHGIAHKDLQMKPAQSLSARRLQSPCPPSTPNGYWSGSLPAAASAPNGWSGCSDVYTTSTYSLTCNDGFFGSGSATCTMDSSFNSLNTYWGFSPSCQFNTDTLSWSGSASCQPCSPSAAPHASVTSSSGSSYQYSCTTPGYYGSPVTLECSTTDGTFSGIPINCLRCTPPAGSSFGSRYLTGSWNWQFSCALGFFGSSVSRTCDVSSGSWSGSPITCNSCVPPVTSNSVSTSVGGSSADTWRWKCSPGYYGTSVQRVCDTTSGLFNGQAPSCAICNTALGGYYCNGGDDLGSNPLGRYPCPAGTYGAPNTALTTPSCSGPCQAGYYCPTGSSTPTVVQCGNVYQYCTTGSGSPITVSSGYYTIPETANPALREGQSPCPTDFLCTGGVKMPPITFGNTCPNGQVTVNLVHGTTNSDFGSPIIATTPGYTGGVVYVLNSGSITPFPGCNPAGLSSSLNYDYATNYLALNSLYTASFLTCGPGFTVSVTASRNNDPSLSTTCSITVAIIQVALPPVWTFCGPVSIVEHSGVGASVNLPLQASIVNNNTALFFVVNTSALTSPFPFYLGLCDGLFRSSADLSWKNQSTYYAPVIARNDGTASGLGIAQSVCTVQINIIRKAQPPVPSILLMTVQERSLPGTWVGNVDAVDPAGYSIISYSVVLVSATGLTSGGPIALSSLSNLDAITIDNLGNVTVNSIVLIPSGFSSVSLTYQLNISNPYITGVYTLLLTVTPSPTPPIAFNAVLSIPEGNYSTPTNIFPALNGTASKPGLSITFSLYPTTSFNVNPVSGIVYVTSGTNLVYAIQNTYMLTVTITDSDSQIGLGSLIIHVTEVNVPPVWILSPPNVIVGAWNFTVNERSPPDTSVGVIQAVDPSLNSNSVVYSVSGVSPLVSVSGQPVVPFSIDPVSGSISVGLVGTGLFYDPSASYLLPYTYMMNVTATDLGVPPLSIYGTAWIQLINIAPRWSSSVYSISQLSAGSLAGVIVFNASAVVWAPYKTSILSYGSNCDLTASGAAVFVINATTGIISTLDNHGVTLFDPNTKMSYQCNLSVVDLSSGQRATSTLSISLKAVNQPPVLPTQKFTTPSLMSGNVGIPLSSVVVDPDLALNIGEHFTFSIYSGNNDTTFAINSNSGQIYVLNNNTPSFQYVANAYFLLTINVTDAGPNGFPYSTLGSVFVYLVPNQLLPFVPFTNLTIPEHSAVGTVVGRVTATSENAQSSFTYTLSPTGANINLPFPFGIRSILVGEGSPAVGEIYVTNAGPINYSPWKGQGMFDVYTGVITVLETRPGLHTSLSSQGTVDIYVTWVEERPFFNPAIIPPGTASQYNSYVFQLSVPEHSPPGTNVTGPIPIKGYSKDPWQQPYLVYSWVVSSSIYSYFSIQASTGAVTLSPSCPNLCYINQSSYSLEVKVTDLNGLFDTATVIINIIAVDNVAVFSGLYDSTNSSVLPGASVSIMETFPVSTTLAVVRFLNINTNPYWSVKRYSFVSSFNSSFFSIDINSGAVSLAPGSQLDYNNQSSYTLIAACTDADPISPLTGYGVITINLIQTNRVSITGFSLSPSAVAGSSLQVSSSAQYSQLYPLSDVLFSTSGSIVLLNGTAFGPTSYKLSVLGLPPSSTSVTATYGPTGVEYTATSCSVYIPNTAISCAVGPGIGSNHIWQVVISNRWNATSTRTTGYIPPAITQVSRNGGNLSDSSTQAMRTDAIGESIILDGTNFGPTYNLGTLFNAILTYGPPSSPSLYSTSSCQMSVQYTEIVCAAVPGVGGLLEFMLTIGGQSSVYFSQSTVRYSPPSISVVQAPVFVTQGGQLFNISGNNMGPAGTQAIVQYSSGFGVPTLPVFTALLCSVPSDAAHVMIVCTSVPGVGAGLSFQASVGGQNSSISTSTASYQVPVISGISGVGASDATTVGGQQIVLQGDQFGPVTQLASDGTPIGLFIPSAVYGPYPSGYPVVPFAYTAVQCRVSVANSQILCLTAPGTGLGLVWMVTVGGQSSSIFTNQTTSYAAPTVAMYSGAGSADALTSGGQTVVITGYNFGPQGTLLQNVTYGKTGNEFVASGCTLTQPHVQITCLTVVGAGSGLSWFVTINGQRSVAPSTNYGRPIIDSFSGPGSSNANTDGGDAVILTGRFFSVPAFLGVVTYGPTGLDYTATNCQVTQDHVQITCYTVPGTGRTLYWVVTVGGQTSDISLSSTSYAAPTLLSLSPSSGPTAGGSTMVLTGINLGLLAPSSQLVIRVNALGVLLPTNSPPSAAQLSTYSSLINAGLPGDSSITEWISSLVSVPALFPQVIPRGLDTVSFYLPTGFGVSCQVLVLVNGVLSNVLNYSYYPPLILNVAPDRLDVSVGQLRLIIVGQNFCSGLSGCGQVLINGIPTQPMNYSDSQVTVVTTDPQTQGGNGSSTVQLLVSGQYSNIVSFSTPVPSFNANMGQGSWGGQTAVIIRSASISFVLTVIGPISNFTLLEPTVSGSLRSSIGDLTKVPISSVFLTSVVDLSSGAVTAVLSTDPANTVSSSSRLLVDQLDRPNVARSLQTSGLNISMSINVATALSSMSDSVTSNTVASLLSSISAYLSSNTTGLSIASALANALGVSPSSFQIVVVPSSLVNNVSTQQVSTGGIMSTLGGELFYIRGVYSIAYVDASLIAILIGGRVCTNLTKFNRQDLSSQYGISSSSPLASQYWTYDLMCSTPAGVGTNLPILIQVPGGLSAANPNFVFSYAPPNISAIVDFLNPSISYTSMGPSGSPMNGIPTIGCSVTIQGSNFGNPSLLVSTQQVPIPSSYALSVTVTDAFGAFVYSPTVLPSNFNQGSITFSMPPWQGANIVISLSVGGQTNTDPMGTSGTRPQTVVRYASPTVTTVFNSITGSQFGSTIGGSPLTIVGSNFGTASFSDSINCGLPIITIGGFSASLLSSFVFYGAQNRLDAILPPGWGANLSVVVTVEGQSSNSNVLYTYAPPAVTSIFPISGPTSGLTLSGSVINMTITGMNFGRDGWIEFVPLVPSSTSVVITVSSSSIYFYNDTTILFPMPEGAGYNLQVVVIVGGQASQQTGVLFSYDPPSVLSISNAGEPLADCLPRIVPTDFGAVVLNLTVYPSYPGCFPTMSSPPYTLLVSGQSFEASYIPMEITLGGQVCSMLSHNHYQATCLAPSGMGSDVPLVVTVGGRSSLLNNASIFSYDPPVITNVIPNIPNAAGGDSIEIDGHNFGPTNSPVSVTIGGIPCLGASWYNDALLKCTTQSDTVGPKNMSVLAANRTTPFVWYEEQGMIEYRCESGSYGLIGEYCVECGVLPGQQEGAFCPGNELYEDLVVSLPGWWRYNSTTPSLCNPLRVDRILTNAAYGGCPVFIACEPTDSCLGANICAEEYTGDRCASCASGFYRVNDSCVKCPNSPWVVVIVFCIGALAALFVAYFLNSKNLNLALISVGMDWAQIVAMFARTRITWPSIVSQIFQILSAFNFNLDLIAPECAIPSVTYEGKWLFIEGLPLIAWVFLLFFFFVRFLWKTIILGRPKKSLFNHLPVLVATGVVVQRVLYLYETRTTLDVFNCSPTDPPNYDKNGKEIEYMAWNLQIVCYQPGGVHLFLLPFAIVALCIYVVGLPIASLWWLRKNKETVKYDQILRAQLTGDDRLTNPSYSFRKTWKALYMNYRPGSWYWEGVVALRKFLIAFCSLMFRETPSYQLAMALLVLFAAYVLQVRINPYLSHAVANETAALHKRKALEGDPLHSRIAEDMRARAAFNSRISKPSSKLGKQDARSRSISASCDSVDAFISMRRTPFQRSLLEGRAVVLASPNLGVLFDYNTAEATLLGSAILINLAGICFDSSRFVGVRTPEIQEEYNGLSYATMIVLFFSIVYWFCALLLDILLVSNPQCMLRSLSNVSKARDRALLHVKSSAFFANSRTALHMDKSGGSSMDPNAIVLSNNPVMVSDALFSDKGNRSLMDVDSIGSMHSPPDAATWRIIQSNYMSLSDRLFSAQKELDKVKLLMESGIEQNSSNRQSRSNSQGRNGLRKKHEFVPVATALESENTLERPKSFNSSLGQMIKNPLKDLHRKS